MRIITLTLVCRFFEKSHQWGHQAFTMCHQTLACRDKNFTASPTWHHAEQEFKTGHLGEDKREARIKWWSSHSHVTAVWQHCAMPILEKKYLNQTDLDLALTRWGVKWGTHTAGECAAWYHNCMSEGGAASTDPLLDKSLAAHKAHIPHLKSGCLLWHKYLYNSWSEAYI